MRESKLDTEVHRETPASEDLLLWCTNITNNIYGLDVIDLTTSWKNGMAFCALIHNFRPDLIDYYKLNPDDSKTNFKAAFEAARKLGIPSIMNSADLMILDVPDKLSVMTVLHQIRAYFTRKERKGRGLDWDCDDLFDDFDSDGENGSLFSSLDQQLTDWPSKKINLDSIISYASPLLDEDHKVNPVDQQKHLEKGNQPTNQSSRLTTFSSKLGEQSNGLNSSIKPFSKEIKTDSALSQSLQSIDCKTDTFGPSKQNTQSPTCSVRQERKPLMTRKQLMNPFDSDSDDDSKPKGKTSQRRASTSSALMNDSSNDILDLATTLNGNSSPTFPDSNPSSSTSSSSSTSTTPSMSTSSSSYSANLSDNSSVTRQSNIQESINRPKVVELAPGLLDVSPKKVSPFQRARGTPSYRSLRLDSKRQTTPDRREKLQQKARQLIEETRKKQSVNQEVNIIASDDERRRQLREKAKKLLSDQISKMIKEKSPIEPRNMEAAIRDLTLSEQKKCPFQSSTIKNNNRKILNSTKLNDEPGNFKTPKKSYVDMELMILEKEQSKIDKEAAIIEEKLRLIMKNGGNSAMEEERCIRKWFALVNKKNEILRRQMKLNILEQEKDLERCYKILIKKLQPLNSLEEWEKTDAQRETEKLLLEKLLRIVEKRNELVHHLDTEEQAEAEDQMVMKETQGPLNFTASEKNCIIF